MKISTLLYSFTAGAIAVWLLLFQSEARAQPAPLAPHTAMERPGTQTSASALATHDPELWKPC
jgi:hypothetical protein